MVYTYTPTYYSSFQDTITSICKSILPFSFKLRRLTADQRRHSDNLKWQQDSFHRMLQLIALQKEGMVLEAEVSAFRSHLLDTLIASPPHNKEPPNVIRDKLLFLQELLYAKCISAEEYHASKRPLLQRLAVQGVEIDCRDVIVGAPATCSSSEEEWSVINLIDDDEEEEEPKKKEKHKQKAQFKSLISNAVSPYKLWSGKSKGAMNTGNPPSKPAPVLESSLPASGKTEKAKKKPFRSLFQKEERHEDDGGKHCIADDEEEMDDKSPQKQWNFDGLKKWKRGNSQLNASQIWGENIKKELSRIQSELCATNPTLNSFSDDQMEAISKKLPIDKADLNRFFPKAWCDRYGDNVLDVVRKEFKGHVGEMQSQRNAAQKKKQSLDFVENDENSHPNLSSQI